MIRTVGDATVGGAIGPRQPNIGHYYVRVKQNRHRLIVKINLKANPVATDWGKYNDSAGLVAGGEHASDGWARQSA